MSVSVIRFCLLSCLYPGALQNVVDHYRELCQFVASWLVLTCKTIDNQHFVRVYVILEWFKHTDYMHQCCYAHASVCMIRFCLLYDHVCTLVHYRMWWTITGNFGNLLPIDWSKSYARQLHTKVLHLQDRRVSHRQGHCPAALTVLDRP